MSVVLTLVFSLVAILNSTELTCQFDTLPNGTPTNYESFFGGPSPFPRLYSFRRPPSPLGLTPERPNTPTISTSPVKSDSLATPINDRHSSIRPIHDAPSTLRPNHVRPSPTRTIPDIPPTVRPTHDSLTARPAHDSPPARPTHDIPSTVRPNQARTSSVKPTHDRLSSVRLITLAKPRSLLGETEEKVEPGIVQQYKFPANVTAYIRHPRRIFQRIKPNQEYRILTNSNGEIFGIFAGNVLNAIYCATRSFRIAMNKESSYFRRLDREEIRRFPGGSEYYIYKNRQRPQH